MAQCDVTFKRDENGKCWVNAHELLNWLINAEIDPDESPEYVFKHIATQISHHLKVLSTK